jgi:hypothetical protein
MGGETDAHRDNEVRAVLAPLAELAARRGVAVVVVCHTRKGGVSTHADDAVLGSVGFVGLARSVLHVLVDPEDTSKSRKLLLPGKSNLAPPVAGFAFRVEGRPPRVEWEGPVGKSADDVLSAMAKPGPDAAALREAMDWLRLALANGPRQSTDLQEEAKNGEGITPGTLRRAQKAARVIAYRPKNPGPWLEAAGRRAGQRAGFSLNTENLSIWSICLRTRRFRGGDGADAQVPLAQSVWPRKARLGLTRADEVMA